MSYIPCPRCGMLKGCICPPAISHQPFVIQTVGSAADRRERIATACLAGMIANPECSGKFEDYANDSVKYADALIARLDKEAKP